MINLRDIEREFDPAIGFLGRGVLVDWKDVPLETNIDGYTLRPCFMDIPLYNSLGGPMGRLWRGWTREENGKHYIAAVEYIPA